MARWAPILSNLGNALDFVPPDRTEKDTGGAAQYKLRPKYSTSLARHTLIGA